MMQFTRKNEWLYLLIAFFLAAGCRSGDPSRQTWAVYKGDAESSSYSSLTQINKENVDQLQVAWTFRPGDAPEGSRYGKYECNPIIVGDVMYATSARHWLYAINARTGEKIWSFDPFEGGRGGGMYRGVAYWEDGADQRILFTAEHYLYAIDARTGLPVAAFGEDGRVNLEIDRGEDPEAWVVPTSPGIVYEDLLILGGEVSELHGAAPGHIRAFDIRTGEVVWTFHTIPRPGEPGYDTWPEDAWTYAGGANNWGGMSLDRQRGIVFVPLGSPTYDFYGADRKGKNLFGNCLVALDAKTGELKWYFQTVHHDVWDYDLPAPPNLVRVEKEGKMIDAVAQTTKSGFLFVLNRETGASLFPLEERPVPPSHIPGEETWPTQPFPLKPEPYAKQHLTPEDLNDISREVYDSVLQEFQALRFEGLFTPPDPKGTLMVPGTRGGAEWGGAAFDPATGVLYINANESPEIAKVQKVKRKKKTENQTVFAWGKAIYQDYCANCHGADRQGQEPINPSLIDLQTRMTKEETVHKIKFGVGRMPAFAKLLKGREEEIVAFLFGLRKEEIVPQAPEEADTTSQYLNLTAYSHFRGPGGHSAIKPPWGTLNAIDLNTGEYAWKIPLGNHPELQKEGAPPTGTENWGGPIVTAGGLVFIGATKDQKFRAFDKENGALLWETTLPGNGYATPATYMCDGKQYVAISVTGDREEPGGFIVAFALSE
jgi:quinoprotein glucose dehydrogenase